MEISIGARVRVRPGVQGWLTSKWRKGIGAIRGPAAIDGALPGKGYPEH